MTRRGFTMPELLVALTLLGVLTAVVVGLLRGTQDAYRAQSQQIDVRQNLRIAAAFLPSELWELDAADGDLVAAAATAITIRAQRRLAVLCQAPQPGATTTSVVLVLRDAPVAGLRDFNPAIDSVLVFSDGDPATPDDDGWAVGAIGSLGPGICPDGRAGRRLTVSLRPAPGHIPGDWGIVTGAPLLGFETLTYRLYRSSEDGRWYIGLQTAADLQPVLGPVTSDGLSFTYLDSSGAVTTQTARVAMIEVRVRVRTVVPVRDARGHLGQPLDSLVTLVTLRNNRRF